MFQRNVLPPSSGIHSEIGGDTFIRPPGLYPFLLKAVNLKYYVTLAKCEL
jgi:hypothetical protein